MMIEELECLKCGNKWYPRTPKKPKMCPACKSRSWEKMKKNHPDQCGSDRKIARNYPDDYFG